MSTEISDIGVFIGLHTLPMKEDMTIDYLDKVFSNYKNYVKERSNNFTSSPEYNDYKSTFEEQLFIPLKYNLIGFYDHCYVSLVDDFIFGPRHFKPLSPGKNNESNNPNFIYQQQTCLSTDKKLIDQFKTIQNEYNSDNKTCLGICNLKLNNSLLFGNGAEFYSEVIKLINIEFPSITVIPLFGMAWNEITLLIFHDNFDFLDKIKRIRDFRLSKLDDNKIKNFTKESFLKKYATKQSAQIKNSHIFTTSYTTIGFKSIDNFPTNNINLNIQTKINCKPGHTHKLSKDILNLFQDKIGFQRVVGMSDLLFTFTLEQYKKFFDSFKTIEYWKYATKIHSLLLVNDEETAQNEEKLGEEKEINGGEEVIQFLDNLKELKFKYNSKVNSSTNHKYPVSIDQIELNLKLLGLGVMVRDRVLALFQMFNHGITDPTLYGFFMELREILIRISNILISKEKIPNPDHYFSAICDYLESAYNNRYGTSYDMTEIPDWNIDYSGGFQQIISSYDYAYKEILKSQLVTRDKEAQNRDNFSSNYFGFVFIKGTSQIQNFDYAIKLNPFHLYHPELFAAIATHEAANIAFLKYQKPDLDKSISNTASKAEIEIIHNTNRHMYADLATYYLVFLDKNNIFLRWWMMIIFMNPSNYNKNGEPILGILYLNLVRLFSLVYYMKWEVRYTCELLKGYPFHYEYYLNKKLTVEQDALSVVKKYYSQFRIYELSVIENHRITNAEKTPIDISTIKAEIAKHYKKFFSNKSEKLSFF